MLKRIAMQFPNDMDSGDPTYYLLMSQESSIMC